MKSLSPPRPAARDRTNERNVDDLICFSLPISLSISLVCAQNAPILHFDLFGKMIRAADFLVSLSVSSRVCCVPSTMRKSHYRNLSRGKFGIRFGFLEQRQKTVRRPKYLSHQKNYYSKSRVFGSFFSPFFVNKCLCPCYYRECECLMIFESAFVMSK